MIKAVCVGRTTYDINLSVTTAPEEGSTNEFFDTTGKVGGSAALVALCLSKWGFHTSIATILGNDVNGNRIKREFEKARIDTRYIEPSYDIDTPISIIVNNESSKKNTIYNVSAKYIGLKRCDFDFTPDIICVDGYDSVQAKNVLERFPKTISVLDASMPTAPVFELIRKAKYAICNLEFAQKATGLKADFQRPETLANIYQKLKSKNLHTEIVITLGERGALYCTNNHVKITPSLKTEVKDTYGCASIFRAAFAHTIALDGDVEKATKIGCIAAGLATTKAGTVDSIPSLEEITNIYEQNYS